MQDHYVVMFDTETKEFSVDIDTTMARFGEEPLFDTEQDAWVSLTPSVNLANYYLVEDSLAKSLTEVTPWA